MAVTWDEYLSVPEIRHKLTDCFRSCKGSFESHRGNIERLTQAISPKTVACLGAGILNDIPYGALVQSGATVHLVDWIPGSTDIGVEFSIIEHCDKGHPNCLYCDLPGETSALYCKNYQTITDPNLTVCDNFQSSESEPLTCRAFKKGDLPSIHYEDVTGGYATEFGRQVAQEMKHARTWKQCFDKATKLAWRIKANRHLPIGTSTVNLATSSMVVSQFAHEPYDFFTRHVFDKFGPPTAENENNLLPAMEKLRDILFAEQAERHLAELDCLLAPGGMCYLSLEMFAAVPNTQRWFMVEGAAKVLDLAGQQFHFNFDILSDTEFLNQFQAGSGNSLAMSIVLESKKKA